MELSDTSLRPRKRVIGYEGPLGAYAVVKGEVVSLRQPQAWVALTDAALLTGLGASAKAPEYQKLVSARLP